MGRSWKGIAIVAWTTLTTLIAVIAVIVDSFVMSLIMAGSVGGLLFVVISVMGQRARSASNPRKMTWMTDSGTEKSHTASLALLGALLHCAARDAELSPRASSAVELDRAEQEILAEVEVALRNQVQDERVLKKALAEVADSLSSVRASDGVVSLTAAKYEKQRTAVLSELGIASAKGASVWPPTSQTAVQRFGSWNEALKTAGLATSSVGRARGQLRFDAGAYEKAIAEFVADCESRGVGATYKAYGEYAAEHKGQVPSAAAVRKFYGSWSKALAAIG